MKKIILVACLAVIGTFAQAGSVKFKSPELLEAYRELLVEFPGTGEQVGRTPNGELCEVSWQTSEATAGTRNVNWPSFHMVAITVVDKSNPTCNTLAKAKSYRCNLYFPSMTLDHNVDTLYWDTVNKQKVLRAVDHKFSESGPFQRINVLRLNRAADGSLSKVSLFEKTVSNNGEHEEELSAACNL